jgi:DNA-binding transcriptional ArsR family regulator
VPTKRQAATKQPTELQVAQALANPIRAAAFRLLGERVASPKDIADETEYPLGTVSYHVRELLKLECIHLVDTAQRRGAIEHYYRAVARATIVVDPIKP